MYLSAMDIRRWVERVGDDGTCRDGEGRWDKWAEAQHV
jgi:hypothetical protein